MIMTVIRAFVKFILFLIGDIPSPYYILTASTCVYVRIRQCYQDGALEILRYSKLRV